MGSTFLVAQDNCKGTLKNAITAAATSIVLETGQGADFPSTYNYLCTIYGETIDDGYEVVLVTNRSSDTLTVTRAQEGTLATAWSIGSAIGLHVNAKYVNDAYDAITGHEDGSVALDAPDINGGTIDDCAIGGTTANSGEFTTLQVGDGSNKKNLILSALDYRRDSTNADADFDWNIDATGTFVQSTVIGSRGVNATLPPMPAGTVLEQVSMYFEMLNDASQCGTALWKTSSTKVKSDVSAFATKDRTTMTSLGSNCYRWDLTTSLPYTMEDACSVIHRVVMTPSAAATNVSFLFTEFVFSTRIQ